MMRIKSIATVSAVFAAAMLLFSCRGKGAGDDYFQIPYSPVAPALDGLLHSPVWQAVPPVVGFHAPWSGLEDVTSFRCFATDSLFLFRFDVKDSTLALTGDYKGERDVEPEDRAEIFFSHAGELDTYIGAEMDPAGRVLDYKCTFYRDFDYDWNFQTLEYRHEILPDGYSIAGQVTLKELSEFGVDFDGGFLMGVFRADYRSDGKVNWYSMKLTDDTKADFHQPSVFFKARLDREARFRMRGVVLSVADLSTVDWPKVAKDNGINTIGTHMLPGEVMDFMASEKGKAFLEECSEY